MESPEHNPQHFDTTLNPFSEAAEGNENTKDENNGYINEKGEFVRGRNVNTLVKGQINNPEESTPEESIKKNKGTTDDELPVHLL